MAILLDINSPAVVTTLKIVEDEKYGKRLISYFGESGLEVTGIARQNYEKAYVRSNVIVSKIQTILDTNSEKIRSFWPL